MGLELECRQDWAAYVLDRLDAEQALACRKHLLECPDCREEVDLLEGAADVLPLLSASAQAAAIARDQALADETIEGAGSDRGPGRGLRAESSQARVAPAGEWPVVDARHDGIGVGRGRSRLLQQAIPKPALAGLGALLVAAVVTVVLSFHGASSRMIWAQTSWPAGGAAVELTGRTGRLLVDSMPAPPAGDVYEVWVRHRHGRLEPKTTFEVGSGGQAALEIPGDLGTGDEVVVSPRPLTGTHPVREQAVLLVLI